MNFFRPVYLRFVRSLSIFLSLSVLLMYPLVAYAATASDTLCTDEFDEGTNSNTECASNQIQLDATGKTNGSGTFTSRVFNATESASWTSLAWSPSQPFLKELPNAKGTDSGYSTGTITMTNNRLLFHFNDGNGASSFSDSSGEGNTGSCNSGSDACPVYTTSTYFNGAYVFDGSNDEITLSSMAVDELIEGTFAIGFWYNPGDSADRPTFGFQGAAVNNSANPVASYDTALNIGDGTSAQFLTALPIANANTWTHYVIVDDGTNYRVYKDGNQVNQQAISRHPGAATDKVFTIGQSGFSGSYADWANGTFDEFFILGTSLDADEVEDIYQRGGNRVEFQVRSCDDSSCIGEIWEGPDGTSATYYSELTTSTNALPTKTLYHLDSDQYFQYKVNFTTEDSSLTPIVLDVTATYSLLGEVVAPEFSDIVYIITLLFGTWYLVRFLRPQQYQY